MRNYKITSTGNTIIADQAFMDANYPEDYTLLPDEVAPSETKYLSKLGFRNRFTMGEKATLEIASLDDPAAPMPARMVAATLRASLADQRDATYIDPLRPDTRAGVIQLETYGVITAGRALEILDAPIEDGERYYG